MLAEVESSRVSTRIPLKGRPGQQLSRRLTDVGLNYVNRSPRAGDDPLKGTIAESCQLLGYGDNKSGFLLAHGITVSDPIANVHQVHRALMRYQALSLGVSLELYV